MSSMKFPQRRPHNLEGGRPKQFSAKIEILVTEQDKVALTAFAQLRSAQEGRQVTLSEVVRLHIGDILNGLTYADGLAKGMQRAHDTEHNNTHPMGG